MTATTAAAAAYIVAALLFVLALAGLSKHETAKAGNAYGIAGMAIALAATIALAARDISAGAIGLLAAAMVVGAGIGLSETLTNDAILGAAPAARAGSASAVSETAYEVGAVLGTAVLGSVLASVYASSIAVPTSIGPVFAQGARETLGGAVALAGHVGGAEGQKLFDAASVAFTHGAAVASTVAVAALVAVAATVVMGLRRS